MTKGLVIRNMTRPEVDELVGWAACEGWNPGLDAAECFWATDPDAFIAAELAGELIGGGAITAYQGEFGFMGFFIVRPEFRGRGLGNTLWHARRERLLARLRPGAGIGLDGVLAMQDYYAKGGFVFSHRNLRFRAEIPERPITPRPLPPTVGNQDIIPLAEIPFDQVLDYDRLCFPAPRATFLKGWLSQPRALALGCRRDGSLSGYGVVRRCGRGYKDRPPVRRRHPSRPSPLRAPGRVRRRRSAVPRRPGEQPCRHRAGTPTPDGRGLRLRPDVSGPGPGYRPPARFRRHHL